MFIAIIGTRRSGKSTLESYLMTRHGFISLRLQPPVELQPNNTFKATSFKTPKSFNGYRSDPPPISIDRDLRRDEKTSFLFLNSPSSIEVNSSVPSTDYFSSPDEMLNHATRNWRLNFVTMDLTSHDTLQDFIIRPFFLLVSVDAPIQERYNRAGRSTNHPVTIDQFLREHDQQVYGHPRPNALSKTSSLQSLDKLVNLQIINSFRSIPDFHDYLDSLNILDSERLRPQWDTYFMQLASLAAHRSNCMKRRVGAILVRNSRILATGYNGTARGLKNCNEGGCRRCNTGGSTGQALDECVCLHAEENALLEAGRERIAEGTILYCNTCPCLRCSVKIIQAGVKEVVYHLAYKVDEASASLFAESGVVLRRHAPPL